MRVFMRFLLLLIAIPVTLASLSATAGLNDLEWDTNRPGRDYDDFHAGNVDKCKKACRRDNQCKAFSYDQDERRCWLKDGRPRKRNANGMVSAVRNRNQGGGGNNAGDRDQSHLPGQVAGVTIERNSVRQGGDYRNMKARNAQDCARRCSNNHRCRAFSYDTRDQGCFLKDRVPKRSNYSWTVSGVKQRGGGGGGGNGGGQGNLPNEVAGVSIERHSVRQGSDYRSQAGPRAVDCAYLCSQEFRCHAFSYDTRSKMCYLKDRVPKRQNYTGTVSGVKRGNYY
jgi:hypothetical protein